MKCGYFAICALARACIAHVAKLNMASPPAKKRRKTRPSSALSSQDSLNSANDRVSELIKLKVFEDAEESDIKTEEDGAIGGELGDVDKELWFFQLPKDVSLRLVSAILHR